MAASSSRQSGIPVDYYVPNFKIEVDGQSLDLTTKGDVLNMSVTMDIEHPTGFMLSINNWDDKKRYFKYSESRIFEIGNRIHIKMGYSEKLLSMVHGIILSMAPTFPESGSPTIAISGVDSHVKLRDKKPGPEDRTTFHDMADWEIAIEVAQRNGLKFKVTQEGEKHHLVVQKDQDELTFLKERASRIDFECSMRVDPNSGEEVLHFVKPTDSRGGDPIRVYMFEWGKSLISFNPVLSVSDQISAITVRSWDPVTKQPISYTAEMKDLPEIQAGGTNGLLAAKHLGRTQYEVINRPVMSKQEARDLAVSLLRERAYKYLTGTGQAIGLPDLRPGDNVELHGLGERFSGPDEKHFCYYVNKATHTLGSSGYMTQFEVRKVCDGEVK